MPPSANTLVVDQLTIEHRTGSETIRPIDDLSFVAEPGTITVLLGPSGCGKTTLLSCLGGLLPAAGGSVRLGDVDVTGLSGRALTAYRRHRVGVVFQAFNLVGSMPAVENVMAPQRAAGIPSRAARSWAGELLDRVGLVGRHDRRPGRLSGGEQQRVAIARALAMDPPLLLADEPTAHLDHVQVSGVLELLRSVADEGRTLLVATHDERVVAIADRIVDLHPATAVAPRRPVTTEPDHRPRKDIVMKRPDPIVERLRHIAPFTTCSDRELDFIGRRIVEHHARPGAALTTEGGAGRELGIIVRGAASVMVHGTVVAELGPGDMFGEVALIDRGTRSASVVADTEVLALVSSAREFEEILGHAPGIGRALMVALARRLRSADEQLAGTASATAV